MKMKIIAGVGTKTPVYPVNLVELSRESALGVLSG